MINPTLQRMVDAVDELSEATVRRMIAAAFEGIPDAQLCRQYQTTDGEPGDPIADLLAIELERREVDF